MFFTKIFQVIIVLIYFIVRISTADVKDCNLHCDGGDQKAVCTLDNDVMCFRFLPSKCQMDLMNCIFQTNYTVYIDSYCEIEGFKCNDELFVQSPPANNLIENF